MAKLRVAQIRGRPATGAIPVDSTESEVSFGNEQEQQFSERFVAPSAFGDPSGQYAEYNALKNTPNFGAALDDAAHTAYNLIEGSSREYAKTQEIEYGIFEKQLRAELEETDGLSAEEKRYMYRDKMKMKKSDIIESMDKETYAPWVTEELGKVLDDKTTNWDVNYTTGTYKREHVKEFKQNITARLAAYEQAAKISGSKGGEEEYKSLMGQVFEMGKMLEDPMFIGMYGDTAPQMIEEKQQKLVSIFLDNLPPDQAEYFLQDETIREGLTMALGEEGFAELEIDARHQIDNILDQEEKKKRKISGKLFDQIRNDMLFNNAHYSMRQIKELDDLTDDDKYRLGATIKQEQEKQAAIRARRAQVAAEYNPNDKYSLRTMPAKLRKQYFSDRFDVWKESSPTTRAAFLVEHYQNGVKVPDYYLKDLNTLNPNDPAQYIAKMETIDQLYNNGANIQLDDDTQIAYANYLNNKPRDQEDAISFIENNKTLFNKEVKKKGGIHEKEMSLKEFKADTGELPSEIIDEELGWDISSQPHVAQEYVKRYGKNLEKFGNTNIAKNKTLIEMRTEFDVMPDGSNTVSKFTPKKVFPNEHLTDDEFKEQVNITIKKNALPEQADVDIEDEDVQLIYHPKQKVYTISKSGIPIINKSGTIMGIVPSSEVYDKYKHQTDTSRRQSRH